MFVRNAWYVAAWSRDVGQVLAAVTVLDENIVMFRTADGAPAALEDACPHRKLPLSMGKLRNGAIECGYHGLTFNHQGRCIAAPTQEKIPTAARVRQYPVVDRWNLLWIWMGDPDAADPAAIPQVPNYDDPAWGRTLGGVMDIDCNYLYVTDNLLDPSHVAWVHVSSFAGAGTEGTPLKIEVGESGVVVSRWLPDRPPPPYYADLLRFPGNCDRLQHYEVVLPSIAINKSIFTPAGTGGSTDGLDERAYVNISYNFMTPISADRTRYFWFQHRNTDPDSAAVTKKMDDGALKAFLEDRDILVEVQKGMANKKTPNIDLAIDAGALRFRRLVDRRIAAEQASAQV
jgi:phenylpropionate dioxygenase-like ring-hydroxylating dioxygenase large terminal subunit